MDIDREKYKALYEYQKLQFEDEKGQFFRLEEKAIRYLSFLTLSIPIYLFIFNFLLNKLQDSINCFLYFVVFFSFLFSILCFCSAWSLIFRSIKLMKIPKLPSDKQLIDFFLDNDLATVYWDRAEKFSEAITIYMRLNEKKINLINLAYNEITFGSWAFVISIGLLVMTKMVFV